MSFWELLILAGTTSTIFGIFVTVYAVINGRNTRKLIQEEAKHTREILDRIEQGQSEARKEMAEARKEMAEMMKEVVEVRREVVEVRKEMAEARKEMAEAIKYLANLIVSEAEKTRQVIRTQS